MAALSEHNQPIGNPVPNWNGAPAIPDTIMHGRTCDVVPLSMDHGPALFAAYSMDQTGTLWTYMASDPLANRATFDAWLQTCCNSTDPLFFAITDKSSGKAIGVASFLRIDPENGVAEVGYIAMSPALQRTTMSTEAMYLMMHRIFAELGYRRYEWKCDALNAASQSAARRLGFQFEGTFRQARVYKGRNRDTAWFSILDHEWPACEAGFKAWLAPGNFDEAGNQRQSLTDLM